MTAIYYLSTPLKLNFFLIGLKQQLAKTQNCPLSTTHSAHNLGFIFDEQRISPTKKLHFPSPATSTSVNSVVSTHSSTSKQPAPLPPPSFTPNSTTATHYITISPTYSYPGFNISRTPLLVQLLKLPSSLTSLLFSNLSTG